MAPLVARSLETLGWPGTPPRVRAAFEAARRINAARSLLAARALGRVLDGLAQAEVPVIALKGVALAESLYGDAGVRVSSDIDVLVPGACVARAFAVMRDLGYARAGHEEPVEAGDLRLLLAGNIEYAFAPPEASGCPVELHWGIAWRWPRDAPALADLWADARPRPFRGAPAQALGPEWELLYLAVHAARHRWGTLKWLVDVHEICRRDAVDWRRVWDKAARFRLTDALEITLGACAALLGTRVPRARRRARLARLASALPGHTRPCRSLAGGALPRAALRPAPGQAALSRPRPLRADPRRAPVHPPSRGARGPVLSAAPAAPGWPLGAGRDRRVA